MRCMLSSLVLHKYFVFYCPHKLRQGRDVFCPISFVCFSVFRWISQNILNLFYLHLVGSLFDGKGIIYSFFGTDGAVMICSPKLFGQSFLSQLNASEHQFLRTFFSPRSIMSQRPFLDPPFLKFCITLIAPLYLEIRELHGISPINGTVDT